MKRKYMLLIISIIICSNLLSFCRNDELDLLLPDTTVKSETNKSKYDINYGPFTPETEYKVNSAYDDFNNIYPLNKSIRNSRYYFHTKKDISTPDMSTDATMLTYISLKTGTSHYICHDPICSHSSGDECKYIDLVFGAFIDDNTFYMTRWEDINGNKYAFDTQTAVYRVDLNNDTVKKVLICEDAVQFITFHNWENNKIYYTSQKWYKTMENGRETQTEKRFICTMNPAGDTVEEIAELPDEYIVESAQLLYAGGNKFWFRSINSVFVTDFSLNNKTVIYTLDKDENIGECYYDEDTKELFFNIYSQENKYGYIYKVKNDTSVEKLSMPSENICTFQMSNKNIYYSECEPIYYGITVIETEREVYDLTGGKIYRTSRDSRDTAELIYDEGALYYFSWYEPYTVIGDYLYFDYSKVERRGNYVTVSYAAAGFKMRIHLKDKTIGIIGFD